MATLDRTVAPRDVEPVTGSCRWGVEVVPCLEGLKPVAVLASERPTYRENPTD